MAASTSGSAAISCASVGLSPTPGVKLPGPCTMKSVPNCESIASPIDAFADAAKIVMNPTSATPMTSAVAVVAVRLGFRAAFSRASVPVVPLMRGSGAAMIRLTLLANSGPSTNAPTKTNNAPIPTNAMPLLTLPKSPTNSTAMPSTIAPPPIARRMPRRGCRSIATSRNAATGGMRAA